MGKPLRQLLCALIFAMAWGCTTAPPEAPPIGRPAPAHISYATGYRRMSGDWSGAQNHWVYGVLDGDWRPHGWPVWIAGQMLFSYTDDAPDLAPGFADSSGTYEFSLGLRRYVAWGRAEPWIGAGAAVLGGSVSEPVSCSGWCYNNTLDDDVVLGWYADAGVQVPLTPLFTLGLAVRWSDGADLDLFGQDVDPGGVSVLALIGTRF